MTTTFKRTHWEQIVSRVTQAKFFFDPNWKCLVCGKRFTHNLCTHTHDENLAVVEQVRAHAA